MSHNFEGTAIWLKTLGVEDSASRSSSARARIREVFFRFRERVAVLAAEIHRDLPDYTVHDITHLDSLWEMASIIAGDNLEVTPTEAFVLGGAILLHDLGMGLAAYPEGLTELKKEESWADIVTAEFQKHFERVPTKDEIQNPPSNVEKAATAFLLRNLHAKQAERLALISWQSSGEESRQYLIDDNEIRQIYGRIIGQIAHSHWWSVDRLDKEFTRTLGAPHWCPNEWIVDPLKVACLLRVSDASHIDARRAPSFLRAIRKRSAFSDEHWKFQEKLQKPYRLEDALAYTSGYAFPLKDAQSWWLCLDTLAMIDRELQQVDALLADKGMQRFAARRVAGIESPERMVSFIPTEGWFPVNAFVQVSDVPRLIKSLGGEELYGANPTVALREMIQNAADAIRARRAVDERPNAWGNINVRLSSDRSGTWLEVDDNGIGMSLEVLTRHLLDFGISYWGSPLMLEEFPGLLSSGFETTGKYGIGFFSVFMLGETVQVRTRRYDAGQDETLILEFNTGLSSRPIIRPASKDERLREGGTTVRVWLEKSPEETGGLLVSQGEDTPMSLADVCEALCPSIDVNINSQRGDAVTQIVTASDWINLSGKDFLERTGHRREADISEEEYNDYVNRAAGNLRILSDEDGEVLGRACITKDGSGVVTVGGLSACRLLGISGLLKGKSERATRDVALPIVRQEVLSAWASEQATLIGKLYDRPEDREECAMTVRLCGGDTQSLPIARYKGEWVSSIDLAKMIDLPNELFLLSSFHVRNIENLKGYRLSSNVILVDSTGIPNILQSLTPFHVSFFWHLWPYVYPHDLSLGFFMRNITGAVVESVAKAWAVSADAVLESSEIREPPKRLIGYVDDDEIVKSVSIIRKPTG